MSCNCPERDAWRCANARRLSDVVTCHCACHRKHLEDPNERGGITCHGKTVFYTPIFDGEYVVRGGQDGQLQIATFADEQQCKDFVNACHSSAYLIRGRRP